MQAGVRKELLQRFFGAEGAPKALVKGDGISLDATWEPADWLTVRSITGYRDVEGKYQADVDRTNRSLSALAISQDQENFSQEFNFSGLEFTADGNLTESLSFNAGVNWMPTAQYTNYKTASVVVPIPGSVGPIFGQTVVPYDASGGRVIKAPEWTANLRLTYATPFMGGEFAATISDAYSPGFYWQAGNLTKEPAYNVANMRLSWTDPNDRFTYSLWATNLTDELYSYYTTPNARGNSNTYPQGRQIGIGVAANF